MNAKRTFTLELANIERLHWVEVERKKAREKYPPEVYRDDEIPANVQDHFRYTLDAPELVASFSHLYQGTRPFSSKYGICFRFKNRRTGDAEHPLAEGDGFEFLGQSKMALGGYANRPDFQWIDLESQNLDMHQESTGLPASTFTQRGREIMEELLSQRQKIIAIPGLRSEDADALKGFLDQVEHEYRDGRIESRSWFYT